MVKKDKKVIFKVADLRCLEHPSFDGMTHPKTKCEACTVIWVASKFAERGGEMKVSADIVRAFKMGLKTKRCE